MFTLCMPKFRDFPKRNVVQQNERPPDHDNVQKETDDPKQNEINHRPIPERFYQQPIQRYGTIGYSSDLVQAIARAKESLTPTPAESAFAHIVERTDVKNIRLRSELTDECVYTYLLPMLKCFYLNGFHISTEKRQRSPYGLVLCSNPETAIATYGCIQKFILDGKLPFIVKVAHQRSAIKDVVSHMQTFCHILVTTHAILNNLLPKAEIMLNRCSYMVLQNVDTWMLSNSKVCPIQRVKDLHTQMKFSGFPTDEHFMLVSVAESFNKSTDKICNIFSSNPHYDIDLDINNEPLL
uniref:DEAD domain-containing protein n=1 Tax=Rhabditophanes sp. KR3021 TaxID=114890 RepID=A0AC35TPL8_9BILA